MKRSTSSASKVAKKPAAKKSAASPKKASAIVLQRAPRTAAGAEQMARLLDIMARLRAPGKGCPWDLEQNLSTLKPFLIEEAYEVLDAMEKGSAEDLEEELGDLLFEIVFQARVCEENGDFSFADVARGICEKMIRRHPHIFGTTKVGGSADVLRNWEAIKKTEGGKTERKSVLDAVAKHAPPLHRAYQIQKRAARAGFDWDHVDKAYAKLREEVGELQDAIHSGIRADIVSELGDVLFAVVKVARFVSCDPAYALDCTNKKFERRFRVVESELAAQGKRMQDCSLAEMETIWNRQRAEEHAAAAKKLAARRPSRTAAAKKPASRKKSK